MLKKRWLISLCAFVIVSMVWQPSVSAAKRTEYSRLIKVMSYNIHFGVGTKGYNLKRTARVIRQSHADIIGLQEVDVHYGARSKYENQVRQLAEALHMYCVYAPIYDFPPPDGSALRRQTGVALLTRFPILASYNHPQTRLLPEAPNSSPKLMPGFLEAVVRVDNKPITVYNTHLDYRDDRRIRDMQVAEMIQIMSNRAGTQLLLGDLNAAPGQPELAPLFQRFRDTLSVCKTECYTFPADTPKWQLDYVMVTPQVKVVRASVIRSKDASDHRPVLASVRVPVV